MIIHFSMQFQLQWTDLLWKHNLILLLQMIWKENIFFFWKMFIVADLASLSIVSPSSWTGWLESFLSNNHESGISL